MLPTLLTVLQFCPLLTDFLSDYALTRTYAINLSGCWMLLRALFVRSLRTEHDQSEVITINECSSWELETDSLY